MEEFDWNPERIAVHLIEYRDPDNPDDGLVHRQLARAEGFPDADESFVDYLDFQLRALVKKRPDTAASSACKVYEFLGNEKGEGDRQLLEERLLMSLEGKGFGAGVDEVLERVMQVPGVKPGLVVLAKVRVLDEVGESGAELLAMLWLDFEDATRFADRPLGLEDVSGVLLRKLGRALLYPHLDEEGPRHDLVKIHCRPAAHPFVGLFAVRPPPTTEQLLQKEVARALFQRGGDAPDRYKTYFERVPSKKRELFGEERIVKVGDLLPERDAAAVARESSRTTRDLYDKEQKLKITIDGTVVVDVKQEQLGTAYFFAQEGEERFMIIRGKSFQSNRAQLSSVDFMQIDSLDDVLNRVRE